MIWMDEVKKADRSWIDEVKKDGANFQTLK